MSNKSCVTCRHNGTLNYREPCHTCVAIGRFSMWESIGQPTGPTAEPAILDSGERREFETGAVRDIQTGKGRCDLLPLRQVAAMVGTIVLPDMVLLGIAAYQEYGDVEHLKVAINNFLAKRRWSLPMAMIEVSKHFEGGCQKYGERNWEKGIPEHCYIDSAVRHYLKWLDGMTDEPHDRAVVWNLLCLWWTHENITLSEEDEEIET